MAKAERQGGRRWTLAVWGAAGLLLVAPAIAMQVSDTMAWTAFDFAFLAVLLVVGALGVELLVRSSASPAYRVGGAVALAATVVLVVANGMVGIIGGDDLDANRLFAAVPATALVGAAVARFRAAGLAWAMLATALVQVAVPVAAASTGSGALAWEPEVLAFTLGLTAAWLFAAWQFRRAAQR